MAVQEGANSCGVANSDGLGGLHGPSETYQVFEGHPQVWAGGRCSSPAALKPAILTQTRIMWFYCLEQNGDSFLWAPQPRYG